MRLLIATAVAAARALYSAMRLARSGPQVVMLSRQSNAPSRDFIALRDEISRTSPSTSIAVRCRRIPDSLGGRLRYVGEVIAQMRLLATASVCLVDGYVIPVSVLRKRPGLTTIQVWHALGAIKQFGYQARGRAGGHSETLVRAMQMHRNYDYVLCGGPASVPAFAAAFDIDPSVVLPLGLPRVDALASGATSEGRASARERVVSRLQLHEGFNTTLVLYAPTFREGSQAAIRSAVEGFGGTDCLLMVRPHPGDKAFVPAEQAVDVSGHDILDLVLAADVVVTDYSATAFEAAVAGTPVFFYVPDIDEYRVRQGLNIDPLEDHPEMAYRDINDIVRRVVAGDYTVDETTAFRDRYISTPGGGCTSAIADLVVRHLPSA